VRESPEITRLVDRLRLLGQAATRLSCLPAAAEIARRINGLQLELGLGVTTASPLVIALMGGTGVGKSRLFNALISREGASPVSDSVRACTRRPYVAIDPGRVRSVRAHSLGALGPEYVDAPGWEVALVDTPDFDSVMTDNRAMLREIVSRCDLIVYVTTHEKMKAYDIVKEVREWAPRKRWLFVLNKADLEADPEALERAFHDQLRDLGFAPVDGTRYLISATASDRFDFSRLRATLKGERTEPQVEAMRLDNFLGLALDAVASREIEQVERTIAELKAREDEYNRKYRDSYRAGLQTALAREALQQALRTQIWRALATRLDWLMGPVVWARVRMSSATAVFRVGQLATRGMGLLGLFAAGFSALNAALRATLPIRQVLASLGPQHRRVIAEIAADSQGWLHDLGLSECPSGPATSSASLQQGTSADLAARITEVGEALVKLLGVGPTDPADAAILESLEEDLRHMALKAADRVATRWRKVLANTLPSLVLAHVLYRIGGAWIRADYLPGSFYGMALGLGFASIIPGYLMFNRAVNSQAFVPDLSGVIDLLGEPQVTAPLRTVRKHLEQFRRDAVHLREELVATRRQLGEALGGGLYGAGIVATSAERRTGSDGPSPQDSYLDGPVRMPRCSTL
jgi:hypothetical protein